MEGALRPQSGAPRAVHGESRALKTRSTSPLTSLTTRRSRVPGLRARGAPHPGYGRRFRLHPRRASIGARVVAAFQRTILADDDGAGMAHRVGVALGEHINVVSRAEQAVEH